MSTERDIIGHDPCPFLYTQRTRSFDYRGLLSSYLVGRRTGSCLGSPGSRVPRWCVSIIQYLRWSKTGQGVERSGRTFRSCDQDFWAFVERHERALLCNTSETVPLQEGIETN